MYVCKYDGGEKKPFFFQNYVTSNDNIQVALWYVSINVLHPGKSKKREREREENRVTRCRCTPGSASLPFGLYRTLLHPDREPMNAALCVRAHTVCPQYHCWVLVCVRAVGVGGLVRKLRRPWDIWPLPHVQVWTMSTKVNFMTRNAADVPLFCGCSCTFLSSECVNLYTWCENSSINVYQENGTKTKNVTF